jgi:CubicO group peptidase (beta-lactamase class C family)
LSAPSGAKIAAAAIVRGDPVAEEYEGGAGPDTLFQTASVGKQFTAALALLLERSGELASLDSPVAPYLLELPHGWRGITMRALLSHTAGISDAGYDAIDLARDYADEEIVEAIVGEGGLASTPGSDWRYSNAGYVLAGIAVGRATGVFYGDLLRDRIFGPLGMTTARVNGPDAPVGKGGGYVSPSLNRLADGGVTVALSDLVRWEGALCGPWGGQVAAMFEEATLSRGAPCGYGLGWFIEGRIAEHDGAWQGFSTAMVRHLDAGIAAVVLVDSPDIDARARARELASGAVVGRR